MSYTKDKTLEMARMAGWACPKDTDDAWVRRQQMMVNIAAKPARTALEALQKLDFDLRAEGGSGLPLEACKIIDTAMAQFSS